MRKLLLLFLLLGILLCGCYRQTTIILQQGETLPKATIAVPTGSESTASQTQPSTVETTHPEPTETEASQAYTEASSIPAGGKKPVSQATVPAQTQSPATTVPNESNTPTEPPSATTALPEETVPVTQPATTMTFEPEITTVPADSTPTESTPPATVSTTPEPTAPDVYDISNHRVGSLERGILEELNRYRLDVGIGELAINKKLSALAAIRAYECSLEWGHTRPDGRSWSSVLSDYGYGVSISAENTLFATPGTGAAALADAWMSSNSHKANILNPEYTAIGIGTYTSDRYLYVVTIFAG